MDGYALLDLLMLTSHVTVTDSDNTLPRQLSPDVLSALQGVRFIAQHIKDADKDNEVSTVP
jgi:nicotinic acetylcholine receptor